MSSRFILFFTFGVLCWVLWLALTLRNRRTRRRRLGPDASGRGMPPQRVRWQPHHWLIVPILALAAAPLLVQWWLLPTVPWALGIPAGLCVVTAALAIGFVAYVRWQRDPIAMAAQNRASSGDVEGGLAMLRSAMERRRTPAREASVGWILTRAGRHAEAAEAFARAEAMSPRTVMFSMEHAVAMAKAGRGEAAAAHLRHLRAGDATEAGYALAESAVLMELGRRDEARQRLRQAEDLFRDYAKPVHLRHTYMGLYRTLRESLGGDGPPLHVHLGTGRIS